MFTTPPRNFFFQCILFFFFFEAPPYEVVFKTKFGLEIKPVEKETREGAVVVGYFSKFSEKKVQL